MTRNEQIWQQALVKAKENPDDFVRGAEWADENPKSKYNISDTDLVRSILVLNGLMKILRVSTIYLTLI